MKLTDILEAILSEVNVQDIVDKYIRSTKYDIENSLGNCSFFTRDFLNWAKENNVKASYVYMPQAKEYREKNNISDRDWEDHIAPMVNNTIIDFAYTPKGVSKKVRTKNTLPPRLFSNTDDLFKPDGASLALVTQRLNSNLEVSNLILSPLSFSFFPNGFRKSRPAPLEIKAKNFGILAQVRLR